MNALIFILIIVAIALLYIVYLVITDKVKLLFGYKQYEYTKILSYGMKTEFMWHKTDEKALEHYKHFEFISEVRPNKRKLKP